MTSFEIKLRAMWSKKPEGIHTSLVGEPELEARLVQAAWHNAGFPQVRAWAEPDALGVGRVKTNLLPGALPPLAEGAAVVGPRQLDLVA